LARQLLLLWASDAPALAKALSGNFDSDIKGRYRMNRKLLALAPIAALALGAQAASAATICAGCEKIDGAAGTYIGSYNPTTLDEGTFNHTGIQGDVGQNTAFTDFFVFDLNPGGMGSISADFTLTTGIRNFVGRLWTAAEGTNCGAGAPSACTAIVPGTLLVTATESNRRWEIIASGLEAGRYIIHVTGETRPSGNSSYSGQLSFTVPEPGTLALLGLGLAGLGLSRRRKAN
jgi:hypothetical protein